jgi:phosphoglycolate phosphatase-like HAD superfamily hydrolase
MLILPLMEQKIFLQSLKKNKTQGSTQHVIFDFDDTLVNSDEFSKAHRLLALEVLIKEGFIDLAHYEAICDISAHQQKLLVAHGTSFDDQLVRLCQFSHLSLKQPEQACKAYNRLLVQSLVNNTVNALPEVCPFVIDTLYALKKQHIPFSIISNSPRYFIKKLLSLSNLTQFDFSHIIADSGNKSERILEVANFNRLDPEEIVYVGDSYTDHAFAVNAGVRSINVNTGADNWLIHKEKASYIEDFKHILPLI